MIRDERDRRIQTAKRLDAESVAPADSREAASFANTRDRGPNGWPDNLPVSLRNSEAVVGFVVSVRRGSDNRRFARVRITVSDNRDGFKVGDVVWPNRDFVPGVGSRLHRCVGCRRDYRGDTGRPDLCALCDDRNIVVSTPRPVMSERPRQPWDIRTPFDAD